MFDKRYIGGNRIYQYYRLGDNKLKVYIKISKIYIKIYKYKIKKFISKIINRTCKYKIKFNILNLSFHILDLKQKTIIAECIIKITKVLCPNYKIINIEYINSPLRNKCFGCIFSKTCLTYNYLKQVY